MYRDPRAYTFPKCVNSVENDSSTISKIRSPSLFFSRTSGVWRQSCLVEVGVTVRVCVC